MPSKLIKLNKQKIEILVDRLNLCELELFDQIIKAHNLGFNLLVMMGLRLIVDSLITRMCVSKKIDIMIIKPNGYENLGLKAKFEKVKK